jgi:hypothetical protein
MWGVVANNTMFWSNGKSWVHTKKCHLHNIDAYVSMQVKKVMEIVEHMCVWKKNMGTILL